MAKKQTEEVVEEVVEESADFTVSEPLIIKPQDMPLVVTPAKGKEWANEAQAEFAKTVNAYAYKNPTKWEGKKAGLLKQLKALETNPGLMNVIRGSVDENTRLTYSNKLMQS